MTARRRAAPPDDADAGATRAGAGRVGGMRRVAARLALWALLALPAILWTAGYLSGRRFYGEYVHLTGLFAVQLLIAALAVTPLTRLAPGLPVSRSLRHSRRYLGVASFAYAALHTAAYCLRQPAARIAEDALSAAFATAWVALLLMAALAITSHDAAVRWLGGRWKALHRLVYPAAGLTFAHWLLTAFDRTEAWVYLGVLLALESLRLVHRGRRRT